MLDFYKYYDLYKEYGIKYMAEKFLFDLHMRKSPPKLKYNFYKNLTPDKYEKELKLWYYRKTGRELDLNNTETFNEKIQWLKLYDSTPLKTKLADKYLVREWIKEKIGEKYLIPLLGVWDKFDDIDFEKLPNQFVLKANHGSGWNIIVKDKTKLDKKMAKKKFDEWLDRNYAFRDFPSEIKDGGYNNFRIETTPEPESPEDKYQIGDHVTFDHVFISSESSVPLIPYMNHGTITRVVPHARNPYLIGNGLGWVNNESITGTLRYLSHPTYRGDSLVDALDQIGDGIPLSDICSGKTYEEVVQNLKNTGKNCFPFSFIPIPPIVVMQKSSDYKLKLHLKIL